MILSLSRSLRCSAAVVIAGVFAAQSLPAAAESLRDAVALAYESNPAIQAERARLRASNEVYVQARSNFGPRISAEAGVTYDRLDRNREIFKGNSDQQSVTLSQPIFTGGRAGASLQAAESDVRAARERLRQAEADLLLRVITAYVGVRRDEQILTVARESVAVLQRQLEETRAKVEVRENTRTDLAQAEARLAAAQAQLFNVQAQLANSRAQYFNIVGRNPVDLEPEPDLGGLPETVEGAFTAAEAGNNTLLAAKYAELGSRARVSVARSQMMPSVDLRLQAARTPQALYLPDPYYNTLMAQATVSQPLFTGGQISSGIRRALETNNADRLLIDSTRRDVVRNVSQQWNLLSAARNALNADQANVTASETAFFGMREEERFGLRSTIELLNAQQELTAAQTSLLRDRYAEYTSRAGLLHSMGRLTVDVIAPDVARYDAEADFDRVKNKGALPTDLVARTLDSVATPPLGPPLPAKETGAPDNNLALPPSPTAAADAPPLRSLTELMNATEGSPLPTAGGR